MKKLRNKGREKLLNRLQTKQIKQFIKDNRIPIEVNMPESLTEYHKQYLEELGFTVLEETDAFFHCDFPKGWKKEAPSFLNCWVYLIDNKKRKRAGIFFRIADKKASKTYYVTYINYIPRYKVVVDHEVRFDVNKRNNEEHKNSPIIGRVVDADDTIVFDAGRFELIHKFGDELYNQEVKEINANLRAKCEKWINEYYPEHDNISKYWED